MKKLLVLLIFIPGTVFAQPKIKKIIVEGEGKPVVLLAGGTADMSAFGATAKELSGMYKVIRMEHFNVQFATEGRTLPENYSAFMESQAIKFTLDSLDINEPLTLVGHSYGGVIALDFALNNPGQISSLILIEPPVFEIAKVKNESPEGMHKMIELSKELTPQAEITEQQVERFRCALMNCDSVSIRQHVQWANWVKHKNRMRGLSAVTEYKPDLGKLRRFNKPVLIVTGEQTEFFHKRIDKLLASEFPNAREIMIQSGHAVPTTAPGQLAKSILDFIK